MIAQCELLRHTQLPQSLNGHHLAALSTESNNFTVVCCSTLEVVGPPALLANQASRQSLELWDNLQEIRCNTQLSPGSAQKHPGLGHT